MKKEFHHIGIPTTIRQSEEIHLAESKLYITDANQSEHRIEWLRFEKGSPMHKLLQRTAHVAYTVDNLEEALKGKKVIIPPFTPMQGVRAAFIREGEAPVEYLEIKAELTQDQGDAMTMKKFINDPVNLTAELLEGFAIAHADRVAIKSGKIVGRARPKSKNKVALVTLGGAGHEPALSGFVGKGMLDYSVVGTRLRRLVRLKVHELRLARRPDLAGDSNHAGDVLSANMASEMAEQEGIRHLKLLTHEDIAPGAAALAEDRRGLAGASPLDKIAGAAAEAGKNFEEVHAIAQRFSDHMATLAVAMRTATHPASGQPIFDLADDEMEIGMGQHGEAGTGACKIATADQTAELMLSRLLLAINAQAGDRLLLILNGSGATTLMELYIILRACKKILDTKGIILAAAQCGEWLTVQEMAGFQMFAAKMDDELLGYWKAPCSTPTLTVAG